MKVLVVGGSGGAGREHAIAWKLSQSKHVTKLYCAPGNPAIGEFAENVDIKSNDIPKLLAFAQNNNIDLTFVGPEQPIADGIVDEFQKHGLKIFGARVAPAKLETSKEFAKTIMDAANVPTARYVVISSLAEAEKASAGFEKAAVKADGLAGGKGVIICHSRPEILNAVKTLTDPGAFGTAGKRIVIEELLEGEEATVLAFCDGKTAKLMVPSQDHKRILDGDKGLNTGGMGAYAPTPVVAGLETQIHDQVFAPVLREMAKRGTPYAGVLYAGLMVKGKDFKVLEFNARFGDPEAQPVLTLLESDLVEIAEACIEGRLADMEIKWKKGAACCVVVASRGYPEKPETGKVVTGIEDANKLKNVMVFQSSAKREGDKLLTTGGRVASVTGTGATIQEAIQNAYLGVACIKFDGMQYRRDIGKAALKKGR